MSDVPPIPSKVVLKPLAQNDFTSNQMIEFEDAAGCSLAQAQGVLQGTAPGSVGKIIRAMVWLELRKTWPQATIDQAGGLEWEIDGQVTTDPPTSPTGRSD